MVQLLPLLIKYFEEQAQDTQNRHSVRSKCRDLHVRISEPIFHLYLFFLNPQLDLLARINKWLQSTTLTLNAVYCKIQALLKTFTAPVTLDSAQSVSDETNLRTVEDAIPLLPGSNLQKQLSDCIEHALLTSRELEEAKSTMYNYILIIGKALERSFPELDFIVQNTAFLDPAIRSMQRPDIEALQCKFDTGKEPFEFDASLLSSQYRIYENDVTIDF